ncbi:MAG: ABC transporter ATP-binding protein [Pseudanabaenaceae cyanobacterium bins.68]|nr:ABC transporter ATP-binding protein [Pseudanabaenaceae cyanobacterium bins.68]
MTKTQLAVEDLSFVWASGKKVLDHCSLEVPIGEFWMLLGSNGSGKSTLLKLLARLIQPQTGKITIGAEVGFVFQNPDHQLVMPTVGADVAFGLVSENLSYAETKVRVAESLAAVNLGGFERRPIYALSGGQKQRVAIAGAIARQAKILLLDEPTALLDQEGQLELVSSVQTLVRQTKITALWVTHRLNELDYADGAFLLEGGRVVEQGDPIRLKARLVKA